jgi:hypothetical protein
MPPSSQGHDVTRRRTWSRIGRIASLSAVAMIALVPGAAHGDRQGAAGWDIVPTQNPVSPASGLADVVALEANDAWGVGEFFDPAEAVSRTLIEHWDGEAWSIHPSPEVGTGYEALDAIDAVSADELWAVGSYHRTRFASEESLILHRKDGAWAQVIAPGQPGWDQITDVSALGPDDVWAVGNGYTGSFIIHWDGQAWSEVSGPNVGWLAAVDARAENDVWIVGQAPNTNGQGGTDYRALALHWDGSSWIEVATPSTGHDFNDLLDVTARAENDVWAVGAAWNSTDPFITFILRFDGQRWRIVRDARVGTDAALSGVLAVGPTDVVAVGTVAGRTLVERWDGRRWRVAPTPSPGTNDGLAAVTESPSGELWAVGSTGVATGWQTLALRSS